MEGIAMSDWVQDAKDREGEERRNRLIEERGRQQKADAITLLLPGWWNSFVSAVRDITKRLKEAFPSDFSRQFEVLPDAGTLALTIRSESAPERLLVVRIHDSFPSAIVSVEELEGIPQKTSD